MTKRLQIAGRVDGSLRDRVAVAIAGVDDWRGVTDPIILADAVIRELKLTRQTNEMDTSGPYRHRYVTEWEPDD